MINCPKICSVILSITLLFTQCFFAHASEGDFWSERRNASNQRPNQPPQFASLPSSLNAPFNSKTFLNQLPSVRANLPEDGSNTFSREKGGRAFPKNLQGLVDSIPSNVGTIQEIYDSRTPTKPVVLIQDVHLNTEAQTNIAGMLQALIEGGQLGLVGVEGAFRPLDFSPFRSFPDETITRQVVDAYFKNNQLAAASYVGITSPIKPPVFIGIDDKPQYEANVNAYLASRTSKKTVSQKIDEMKRALTKERSTVFSNELMRFDDVRQAYHKGDLGFGVYLKGLAGYGEETGFVVDQFLAAYAMESGIDFQKVEQERHAAVEKLAKALSEAELSSLVTQSLAYRMGRMGFGAYYRELNDLCEKKGVLISAYPNFDNYIRYVLLSDSIKADRLFDAVEKLETRILQSLIKTPEQKRVVEASEFIVLTEKLIGFSLTPREWDRWRANKELPLVSTPINHLLSQLVPFEQFYVQADIRSHKMVENLLANQNQNLKGSLAMVVGGFHQPLITTLLREREISFVVVSPKISKVEVEAGSAYLSVFACEKTPLDKLFSGEKLFINPTFPNDVGGAQGFRMLAGMTARFEQVANVVVAIGSRAFKAHVEILSKADAVQDRINLTWGERLYLAVGVNWEVVFQWLIPVSVWLAPNIPEIMLIAWIVSAIAFARAHPKNRIFMFLVGVGLGVPFVFGAYLTSNGSADSMLFHSAYNTLKLVGLLPKWMPFASTVPPSSESDQPGKRKRTPKKQKSPEQTGQALQDMAEPQLANTNAYATALIRLLRGPEVTEESVKRRAALRRIGPKIEKFIRELMDNKKIHIVLTPLGSALKGYAAEGSDIEYKLYILSGLENYDSIIEDEIDDQIRDEMTRLLQEEGYRAEVLQGAIDSINNHSDITAQNLGFYEDEDGDDEYVGISGHDFSELFHPVVYGNARLVEKARKNILSFLKQKDDANFFWDEVQADYRESITIETDQIPNKPHLRAWLTAQGVDVSSAEEINKFVVNRNRQIGLPSFTRMADIYLPADGGKKSSSQGGLLYSIKYFVLQIFPSLSPSYYDRWIGPLLENGLVFLLQATLRFYGMDAVTSALWSWGIFSTVHFVEWMVALIAWSLDKEARSERGPPLPINFGLSLAIAGFSIAFLSIFPVSSALSLPFLGYVLSSTLFHVGVNNGASRVAMRQGARWLADIGVALHSKDIAALVEIKPIGVGNFGVSNDSEAALIGQLNGWVKDPAFRAYLVNALRGRMKGRFGSDAELNTFIDLLISVVLVKGGSRQQLRNADIGSNHLFLFRGKTAGKKDRSLRNIGIMTTLLQMGSNSANSFVVDGDAREEIENVVNAMRTYGLNIGNATIETDDALLRRSKADLGYLELKYGNLSLIILPGQMKPDNAPPYVIAFEDLMASIASLNISNITKLLRSVMIAA